MRRRAMCAIGVGLWSGVLSAVCWASPSGLNNIPTADVAGPGVLVIQGWTAFGAHQETTEMLGAKYGPAPGWEIGLDTQVGPGSVGPLTAQVKRQFSTGKGGPLLALGVANVSASTEDAGEWMPYLVATQPLEGFRLHLGYSAQNDNSGLFFGADAQCGMTLTLRSDYVTTNDGDDYTASLGFLWLARPALAVEAWASFPSASGAEDSVVIKLDWILETNL